MVWFSEGIVGVFVCVCARAHVCFSSAHPVAYLVEAEVFQKKKISIQFKQVYVLMTFILHYLLAV